MMPQAKADLNVDELGDEYRTNRFGLNGLSTGSRFSLLELLVVITVIVILVSMLLPALGRTRYMSRLALCTNTLRQLGLMVTAYTNDHDAMFPAGNVIDGGGDSRSFLAISYFNPNRDDRPIYSGYIDDFNLYFQCPLSPNSNGTTLNAPLDGSFAWLVSGYEVWYGGHYDKTVPMSAVRKLGDRPKYGTPTGTFEFDVLAADMDYKRTTVAPWRWTSHPETSSALEARSGTLIPNWGGIYGSLHVVEATNVRGSLDRNFLHDDLSTTRLYQISESDPRVARLPAAPSYATQGFYMFLPPAR